MSSNKAYFENDVRERASKLDNLNDMLCIGSLTLAPYISSARSAMVTQHLVQALVPDKPEIPGVSTTYEHMFGKFSTAYKKTDNKLKVIKKINKYDGYVYTLLVYDPKTDEYDIINRREIRHMAEGYGYKWNNDVVDGLNENDIISKDTTLYRAPSIDEYGNYMYGANAKAVYVVSQETIEDAVVVSESFANKLSTTKVKEIMVPLNDNDVMLNLYGDNSDYKSFPDIGERTKKSILCGTRKRNKTLDQLNMKNSNLKKIFPNDDIFQMNSNYTVVDIDIWSNKPYEEISDLPVYSQVKRYYKRILNYYTEIYETFGELMDSGKKYTKELSRLYAKARDYINPNCKYVDDDKMFSNIVMEFTIERSDKLKRGCKLCGRYGNKSVISKVISDKEMGMTEDGLVPDIRIDALGVVGRLNSGQCIEQELNWIAEAVRQKMMTKKNTKDKLSLLLKFIKLANKEEYEKLVKFLEKMSDDEKNEFVEEIINDRIYITQSPMGCINGDGLLRLFNEFEPKKTAMIYTDENGREYKSIRKMIVADEYILRLKQEPDTKYSVRSKSMINPRSFLPIKSTKASKHKTIYADQSNRIGEQELLVLMLANDPDALDYFYRSYSSSVAGRRSTTLFEADPDNGFVINMPSEHSRVVDMFMAYFKTMGYKLDIEYEDSVPDTVTAECDTPDIPGYLKKLF